jgi:hypothetical protein
MSNLKIRSIVNGFARSRTPDNSFAKIYVYQYDVINGESSDRSIRITKLVLVDKDSWIAEGGKESSIVKTYKGKGLIKEVIHLKTNTLLNIIYALRP